MSQSQRITPPLSPVLLAGFAIRPLPLALLQPILNMAMDLIHDSHPDVFDRLSVLDGPVFRIDPVDLPFDLILVPDRDNPELTAIPDDSDRDATAVIRGPLLRLIELLEGRIDGDAMFFSRDLVIEGDTEAVVALRNAVDGAEIDIIGDILSRLGPLATPARMASNAAGSVFSWMASDLEKFRAALIAPSMRRNDAQSAELRELEKKIDGYVSRRRRKNTDH